jgi:hypothetical protein
MALDDEIEYVTCTGCDTPCYIFDINPQGKIVAAVCTECGNDDPNEFVIPGEEKPGGEGGS